MFYYHTLKELEDLVNENKLEVWQVVEQSDMEENGRTKEQSYEKMLNMYLAWKFKVSQQKSRWRWRKNSQI